MAKWQLIINGIIYDEGFEFKSNPSIELKRDETSRAIYEDPGFDFIARGQLCKDLSGYVAGSSGCLSLDVEVVRNKVTEWVGKIKTSDIIHHYNSPEKGTYKEVEIIDRNYKAYFKPYGKIKVDIQSPYDLECEKLDSIPEPLYQNFFDPNDLPTDYLRKTFRLYDVLEHITLLITRNNVVFESDYLSSNEQEYLSIALGDWITEQFSIKPLIVSWDQILTDLCKYHNLWIRYYENSGVPTVRVEPYSYFFDSGNFYFFENASSVSTVTQIDKLYATVKIGDSSPVTNYADAAYVDFQFDTFRDQEINVSDDCSFDSELSLTGSILYDSDKIQYVLLEGDDDDQYADNLFFVETDGTDVTRFNRGSAIFYNQSFLNSRILVRYFDSVAPISLAPENFVGVDYFQCQNSEIRTYGVVATPGAYQLDFLWFDGDIIQYDNDGTLSTVFRQDNINGTPSVSSTDATLFTATVSGSRSFFVDANVAFYGGSSIVGTPMFTAVVRTRDVSAGVYSYHLSEPVEVLFNSGLRKLTYETDPIFLDVGDTAELYLISNSVTAIAGVINYAFGEDSKFGTAACSKFDGKFVADGYKRLINEINYDDYPISKVDFDTIRSNPGQLIKLSSNEYNLSGYIDSFKYDMETCQTQVKLISKNAAQMTGESPIGAFGSVFDETFGDEFD